jgi:hypothetical protein
LLPPLLERLHFGVARIRFATRRSISAFVKRLVPRQQIGLLSAQLPFDGISQARQFVAVAFGV